MAAEKLNQAFRNWDEACDGVITRGELEHVLHALGMERANCSKLATLADTKGTGIIDYGEFCAWLVKAPDDECTMKFRIENISVIKGVGSIVAGVVEKGFLAKGSMVAFLPSHSEAQPCLARVREIQRSHKKWDSASAGENVGVLVKLEKGSCKPQDADTMVYHSGPRGTPSPADQQVRAPTEPMTLIRAAAIGNNDKVKELLESSADVNAPLEDSWAPGVDRSTALHYAVQGSHIEVVRTLLAAKANPFAKDESSGGDDTFHYARNPEIASLLSNA